MIPGTGPNLLHDVHALDNGREILVGDQWRRDDEVAGCCVSGQGMGLLVRDLINLAPRLETKLEERVNLSYDYGLSN